MRKATLTKSPFRGKGKGKGGCRGRKPLASAKAKRDVGELIAARFLELNGYISFIADCLRIATYNDAGPKAQSKGDGSQLSLFKAQAKRNLNVVRHPADDDREEVIPSCAITDEEFAEVFGESNG